MHLIRHWRLAFCKSHCAPCGHSSFLQPFRERFFLCGMQKCRLSTDPIRYPPDNEYLSYDLPHSDQAWQASNPPGGPLSMSQGAWSMRFNHSSLSSILKNLQKFFYRQQFASEAHNFPPSFVRRTQSPWTSSTRPSIISTARFLTMCIFWYTTSALSSNTGKAILEQFRYPVTLTIIQFGFVAFCCLIIMSPAINFSKLRSPTAAILRATLPMGAFQVGGHMFSSMAISRIHVSTVHTVKVCHIPFFSSPRCSSNTKGIIPALHRCRVRTFVSGQILSEDIHISPSFDHRSHVSVHF